MDTSTRRATILGISWCVLFILVTLKLFGKIDWSWWIILLPAYWWYVVVFGYAVFLSLKYKFFTKKNRK